MTAVRRRTARARGSLTEYQRKRRFERTPEPRGRVASAPRASARASRFVIQEHHASVLHFDFRLEIGGVLKSWSVPKGPSLDPTVKRLAVEVEDHPVEYLTFRGEIPDGYGAGQVYRWDIGTFTLEEDGDPLAAWTRGTLKFRLNGKRLHGAFRLVLMKGRQEGGKPMWLLFKSRDEFAEPGYAIEYEAPPGRRDDGAERAPARKRRSEGTARRPLARPRARTAKAAPRASAPISLDEFLSLRSPSGDCAVEIEGHAVSLTSLDRVYWPDDGITKFQLLRYYARVWDVMRPYVEERPVILQRWPEGVAGERFVQHDLPDAPQFVRRARMLGEKGRSIHYAVVSGLASVLYLANLGVIELHTWHSRVGSIQSPDWVVLDLDPGAAPWKSVLETARAVRAVCEERRLEAYPKTSGSRGIHVYVPLPPRQTYAKAASLARELADDVAARLPRMATVVRSKAGREGRLYVDWMQNARAKSLAAPFSARARPGATVAAPLTWAQVERGVQIADFTIDSVPRRLPSLVRAWSGFLDRRR